jgi:hypothetical protein
MYYKRASYYGHENARNVENRAMIKKKQQPRVYIRKSYMLDLF